MSIASEYLNTLSLSALVAHFNAIQGVKPVKKFASKADAIKRIIAAQQEVPVAEVEKVEEPVETVSGHVSGVSAPLLTPLQYLVMDRIAHAEHNTTNGATPETSSDVNTWLWGDDLADRTGLTVNQVGGVLASLINAELIIVGDIGTKEASVSFTEEGFAGWQIIHSTLGSPDSEEYLRPLHSSEGQLGMTRQTDDGPVFEPLAEDGSFFEVNEAPSSNGGFQYKTRDELKDLAATDAAARQAYRMARRKAARAARKAKKAK